MSALRLVSFKQSVGAYISSQRQHLLKKMASSFVCFDLARLAWVNNQLRKSLPSSFVRGWLKFGPSFYLLHF